MTDADAPLPAALVSRGIGRLLCRDRRQRTGAELRDEDELAQHDGDEPKTLCNGCVVVEFETEGGGGITTAPAEQGSPLIEFLPIVGASIAVVSAGETAAWGALVTVFPLSIGLLVFVLGICASAIAMVAVKPRVLRPISAM